MRCILVFIGGLAVGILTGIGIHAAGEDDDQKNGQESIGEDEDVEVEVVQEEEAQVSQTDEDSDDLDEDEDGVEVYRSILFRRF